MVALLRIAIAIIILTLLITYAIVPFIKYIRGFMNKEIKRIDNSLTNTKREKDEVE